MFKKLLVFKLWNKLFKITSCHLELSRRVSKIRVQLKLRKQNNKNPRRSFDSASSAQSLFDKSKIWNIAISDLPSIFYKNGDRSLRMTSGERKKERFLHSKNQRFSTVEMASVGITIPSVLCHLERSREIQPSANWVYPLPDPITLVPRTRINLTKHNLNLLTNQKTILPYCSKNHGLKKEFLTSFLNIFRIFRKKRHITMDITKLIGDLGFPIVVSLILIYKLDYKLDEILK